MHNIHDRTDHRMSFAEFIKESRAQNVYCEPEGLSRSCVLTQTRCLLTLPMNAEDRRLYWKDADCPDQWKEWLRRVIPPEIMAHGPGDLLGHLYEKVGSIT